MKYVQETKSLLETECLDEKQRMLSELLQEKSVILKALDDEILDICLTQKIEQKIKEAEDIHSKIVVVHAG